MTIKNITQNTIVTKDLKVATTFIDKTLGLLSSTNPRSLLIKTRFGIHTLFLKEIIDVIILDNNLRVVALRTIHPNSFYFYNPKHHRVLELPHGTIKKSKTKFGDQLKMLE